LFLAGREVNQILIKITSLLDKEEISNKIQEEEDI
jgi:hypothetical protein